MWFYISPLFLGSAAENCPRTMIDIKAWAEYVVEWAAKDPYGFLTTVILALTPLFIASALLSWKLAKMIEAKEREQKKKQKRQENIAKAKRAKKDWAWDREGSTYSPIPWCMALLLTTDSSYGTWSKTGSGGLSKPLEGTYKGRVDCLISIAGLQYFSRILSIQWKMHCIIVLSTTVQYSAFHFLLGWLFFPKLNPQNT